MIKELLLSVDISNRNSVLNTISYLYAVMPKDPAAEAQFLAEDEALMRLDYDRLNDPFNPNQLTLEGVEHANPATNS